MAIKGGNVYVDNSEVTGLGEAGSISEPTVDNVSLSGFVDTGDGIYIETNYEKAIKLEVSGSDTRISSTADGTYAIRVFPEANYVTVSVTGGTFTSDIEAYLADGYYRSLMNDLTYVVTGP